MAPFQRRMTVWASSLKLFPTAQALEAVACLSVSREGGAAVAVAGVPARTDEGMPGGDHLSSVRAERNRQTGQEPGCQAPGRMIRQAGPATYHPNRPAQADTALGKTRQVQGVAGPQVMIVVDRPAY
jgi:hypothetical protein